MLQSVPKLEMLTLEVSMAESSSDQPQEPCAFSQLAHLKHLSLCDYAWVPHIDAAVASRLESLAVDALEGPNKQYDLSKLPAAFAKMATLKSLQLSATAGEACFSPKECRLLLDAAPPFLETLTLHRVEPSEDMSVTVTCTFANGLLACVRLEDQLGFQGATQAQLGAFWARALLPSRKLGPRLPRLILDMILVVDGGEGEVPDAGAAEVLLARCSEVQLGSLNVDAGASVEAVERAARLYGLPARISHHALSVGGVYLRQGDAPPLGASGLKLPSIPLPPAPLPLRPAAVVERVVERLAAAAGTSSEAFNSCVLLRGTYVRELLAHPTARRIWVGGLAWVTNAASNGQGTVEAFWTLPSVGAVVLQCGRGPTGQAVAEVAAEKARGCQVVAEMDPAAAAGLIEALTTGPSVEYSVDRVLQALWDGAEEGGPGPATGSREGELARLRWLLETWEGLRGIMTKMHIAPGA
ncbi:hypothetical protein HYH03_010083 [Edaphochlamys debaryana]|uniref:Uncharacterized protein n=1 Tax=Edaphochlamys debaryana TaxID=47281 RepID=A0A835XWJ2_9CHLO|nr:hypothetical protein HYH03_010083 [Edaphochlamys debaryana]|eukprot:KAG2491506.1 hypothetical protein HYH03_010083 [Edaphochlamys debaryana]